MRSENEIREAIQQAKDLIIEKGKSNRIIKNIGWIEPVPAELMARLMIRNFEWVLEKPSNKRRLI